MKFEKKLSSSGPAPATVERVSPYANAKEPQNRAEFPNPGTYIVRVIGNTDTPAEDNPTIRWFRGIVQIHTILSGGEGHTVGDQVLFLQQVAGPGAPKGVGHVRKYLRYAAGYASSQEYDVYNPHGFFEEAQVGLANEYSARGEFVLGRLVKVTVTQGAPAKDGGFYRNYDWAVVPDESDDPDVITQDQVGKVGAE